jgi:hypothetical protein
MMGRWSAASSNFRQLGHKNAAYSLQYARITDAELQTVVDDRQ